MVIAHILFINSPIYIDTDEKAEEAFRVATDINYDPFKEKLQRTLEQYEQAMLDPEGFRNPKEREVASTIVEDLRNQLARIEKVTRKNNDNETERDLKSMIKSMSTTIEDKRVRGLREIFSFYSHQHLPEGLEFGDIEKKKNILDLGEFLIFTKDFKVPLNKKKCIEIFKKTSSLRQLPVNFEEFCEVIDKVGIEINLEKIHNIKKRLKEIRKIEKDQKLISPEKQRKIDEEKQKEEEEKKAKDEESKNPPTEAEGEDKEAEGEGDNDTKQPKTKKSVTKTSKSGDNSAADNSDSDSKSKTTMKTGECGFIYSCRENRQD